ncbi:hypothetical protein BpHYR1_026170 [Brachionus plicatilis]|uniref:Uncharacterized protein n=1 Tax=Brachionus plicatilis TaxID=10195 RepID=A0A3M7T7F6_BRAPC|nr:hypothetical protein BpHYR1_026170 [Brachionus plicatilis]
MKILNKIKSTNKKFIKFSQLEIPINTPYDKFKINASIWVIAMKFSVLFDGFIVQKKFMNTTKFLK